MSMWQEIQIEMPEAVELPQLGALLALWQIHVERALWIHAEDEHYYNTFNVDGADPFAEGEHLPEERRAYLQFSSKWQTEGLRDFIEAVSIRYPAAVLTLREEWTGEDANITRERWQGGHLVASIDSEGDLIPQPSAASADALGAFLDDSALMLGEVLGALGRLSETLSMVEVGEDFWEHFQQVEADQLADVFDCAGMTASATMIRDRARAADPEAWEGAAAS